jgi:hypothetical protein
MSLRAENGRLKNLLSGMKELSKRGQPHDSSNDDKLSMGQRAAQDGSTGMKYSRIHDSKTIPCFFSMLVSNGRTPEVISGVVVCAHASEIQIDRARSWRVASSFFS